MKNRVIAIGDVIEDILVKPKGEIRMDTDTLASIATKPGGSAGNYACWLASLGVSVDFVGRVGAETLQRHNKEFLDHGVTPHLQADSELPTGTIVVLVEGQHRTFLTDRGANRNLDLSLIPDSLFESAAVLYLSGYSFIESLSQEEVATLIAKAKASGLKVVVDPGSAGFIADFGARKFLDVISGATLIVPSLEEGRLLTGEDRPEVIAEILAKEFEQVAVTLGENGVCIAQGSEILRIPAFVAEVVDATGAGDSFAAGITKYLLQGKSLAEAAQEATRVAAKAVTISGGRPKPQKV